MENYYSYILTGKDNVHICKLLNKDTKESVLIYTNYYDMSTGNNKFVMYTQLWEPLSLEKYIEYKLKYGF